MQALKQLIQMWHQRKMSVRKVLLLVGLFIVGLVLFVNPNPFGNQPSVIADEAYFLTSAVKAIQDHTLPGWVSDPTAAYYGGVLTYLLFGMVAVGGVVALALRAHVADISVWIAFHWGDLIHLGRLINGLAVYLSLIWVGVQSFRLAKRGKDSSIAWFAFFALTLLCGGSVFVPLAHTSKVWPIYIVIELIAAWVVVSREWKIQHQIPVSEKKSYLDALFVLSLLSVSQVLLSSLTFLWIGDALLLRHITWRDLYFYLKRPVVWVIGIGALLLNVSFIKNFYLLFVRASSLNSVSGNIVTSAHPWMERIVWPWKTLWETHPVLAILFAVSLLGVAKWKKIASRDRVLFIHAMIVYVLFYLILGFGNNIRYILPLTAAVTFFVAVRLGDLSQWRKGIAFACALSAVVVLGKTAWLFWHPSSAMILDQQLRHAPISSEALLVIKTGHFQVPILNDLSIQFTNQYADLPAFRRFTMLEDSSFKDQEFPFTISVGAPHEIPKNTFGEVWTIDEIDTSTTQVTEGATMKDLLTTGVIGRPYLLQKQESF